MTLAIWYCVALAVSAALVPVCRSIALKKGVVARPRNDRWNSRPTPLFGGVAIAVTVLGLALAAGDLRDLALPLIGGLAIVIVGITDDVISLKPATKLIAEIALAAMFVGCTHLGLEIVAWGQFVSQIRTSVSFGAT